MNDKNKMYKSYAVQFPDFPMLMTDCRYTNKLFGHLDLVPANNYVCEHSEDFNKHSAFLQREAVHCVLQ